MVADVRQLQYADDIAFTVLSMACEDGIRATDGDRPLEKALDQVFANRSYTQALMSRQIPPNNWKGGGGGGGGAEEAVEAAAVALPPPTISHLG